MIKSIKAILAQDKEKFKVPRKVQDLIPIKNIWPDGIFKVGNKFSKSFRFSDINYLVASREDKESMFLTYSELLLIKQMSMASGYSSSAIRERIYFGDDMSGVLLYTGSSDKEGSLGGLVELGNISQLRILMRDAFQEALVCTNDPECLNNTPAGNNSNGAACHSCCMISETACENGNRMLDRGLIVPIDGREDQAYFKALVEELCQLDA